MLKKYLLVTALVLLPGLVTAATFTRPLTVGSQGADVTTLQRILQQQGYLAAAPTGFFGPLTAGALAKFQTAHGIEALGGVGPKTRTLLNSLSTTASTPTDKATLLASLLAQLKILQAQIAALLAGGATSTGATLLVGTPAIIQNYTPPAGGGGGLPGQGGGGGGGGNTVNSTTSSGGGNGNGNGNNNNTPNYGNGPFSSYFTSGIFSIPASDSPSAASQISVAQDTTVSVNGTTGQDTVKLRGGNSITKNGGGSLDVTALTATDLDPASLTLPSDTVAEGAVQFGVPGVALSFTQPTTITISVSPSNNGDTLNIYRAESLTGPWLTTGLSATTCVVSGGLCQFDTTLASQFAATRLKPTVSISASPISVITGNSSALTWASTNATSCTASGGWSGTKTLSGTQTLLNLTTNQTYTLTCSGRSKGGSATQSASVTVTGTPADTTAPSAPTALAGTATSQTQINLTWTASTDAVGVTGYRVFRNGTQIASPTTNSYSDASLIASTAYTYTVKAIDAAANLSLASNSVSITTLAPVPTVTISASPTSVTSGSGSTITWSSTNATTCTASGAWNGTKATSGTQSFTNLSTSQTYTLQCTGTGGSATQSASVTITAPVDTTPPSVTIIAPTVNLAAGTTQTTLSATTNENATCRYSTTASFAFSAGTLFTTTGALSHSTALSPLTNGTSYTYYVKCSDASNNISGNASVTFSVASPADTTAPTVPTGLSATAISSSAINLTWTASTDAVGVTGYKIFRGGTRIATAATNSYSDTGLSASTNYSYTVSANDAAGNNSAQSASASAPTQAGGGGGTCPKGTTLGDGCTGAPGGTAQFPNILSSYGANRPPWNVAGVEYYVGVPAGTVLKDPSVQGNLPVGATANASLHVVQITANNVTLSGYDFSLHGGWGVSIPNGVTGTTITNSNFVYSINPIIPIQAVGSGIANLTVANNNFIGSPNDQGIAIQYNGGGAFIVKYNYFSTQGTDAIDPGANPAGFTPTIEYNLFYGIGVTSGAHNDPIQFYAGNVSNGITAYNTIYQPQGLLQTHNYQLTIASEATANINNQMVSNNTIINTGPTPTATFTFAITTESTATLTNTTYQNNYFDPTGDDFGIWYPSSGSQWGNNTHIWNNVNMTNGTVSVPSVTGPYLLSPPGSADSTPPSTPTNPSASAVSSSQINLTWTASTDNVGVTGYQVFRNGVQVGSPTTNSYSDTGLSASTQYSYTVKALDATGNLSAASTAASATTQAAASGSNLVANPGFESSTFTSWALTGNVAVISGGPQAGVSATGPHTGTYSASLGPVGTDGIMTQNIPTTAGQQYTFDFWLSNNGGTPNDFIAKWNGQAKLTLTNSATQSYTHYTYTVTATAATTPIEFDFRQDPTHWNLDDISVVATGGTAPPDTTPPSAPTNLSASAVSSSQINLAWTASTDNVGVTGYQVFRGGTLVASPTTNSYSDTGLSASTNYSYTIKATDMAGNVSTASTAASATTQAGGGGGAIQFPNILSGYTLRPSWQVAGVDYVVGIPAGTVLKNPSTISMSGVGVNGSTHVITVSSSNATLDGYDFSLSGGWEIDVGSGATNVTIQNSNFKVGVNGGIPIFADLAGSINILHNKFDGGAASGAGVSSMIYTGASAVIQYNQFTNFPNDAIDLVRSGSFTIQYNLFDTMNFGVYHTDCIQTYDTTGAGQNIGSLLIEYNTMYQPPTWAGQMNSFSRVGDQGVGVVNNAIADHNTIVFPANTAGGNTSSVFNWGLGGGAGTLVNPSIHDNFVDATGVLYQPISTYYEDTGIKNPMSYGNWNLPSNKGLFNGPYEKQISDTAFYPTSAPAAPVISSATPNGSTVQISGTAPSGTTIVILNQATGIPVGSALVNGTSWSFTTPSLANGSYTVFARANDTNINSGAISNAMSATVGGGSTDATPPSTPNNLSASALSSSQITLSWTASTDNVGVTGYRVFRAGVQVGTPTTNSYSDTGLSASTNYSYTVKAIDAAGNLSAASAAANATTQAATTGGACPKGSAYPDGCAAAPVGAAPHPTLFNSYSVRPPWNVAGVEYAVGPTITTFKIPGVNAAPACVTVDNVNKDFNINSDNCVIDGWDFTGGGGWQIYGPGMNNVTITNNKFLIGSLGQMSIRLLGQGNGFSKGAGVTIVNNIIDGGSVNTGGNAPLFLSIDGPTLIEYNWIKNAGADLIDGPGGSSIIKYNILENDAQADGIGGASLHPDWYQTYAGNSYPSTVIDYNTILQTQFPGGSGGGGTQGFTLDGNSNPPLATFGNIDGSNNTIVITALPQGNTGFAFRYALDQTTGTVSFNNNYVDATGLSMPGAGQPSDAVIFRESSSGLKVTGTLLKSGNTNLLNGSLYPSTSGGGADTTPPVITITAPTGALAAGTTQTTLSVTTNETATCAWSTTAGTAFASMTTLSTTGGALHSTTISGLTNGSSYTTYVKCKDAAGTISADSSTSYSVAIAGGGTTPVSYISDADKIDQTGTNVDSFTSFAVSGTKPTIIVTAALSSATGNVSSIALSGGLTGGTPYLCKQQRNGITDLEVWAIPAPSGTGTITVNYSVTADHQSNAALLQGANQTTPCVTTDSAGTTGNNVTPLSVTATNLTANDMVIYGGAQTVTGDAPHAIVGTEIFYGNSTATNLAVGYHAGTGAVTATWSQTAPTEAMISARVQP